MNSRRVESTRELIEMKRKVLIVVENEPVPFDRRVWLEACALRENGYDVTVLCPRRHDFPRGHEMIDGIRVYRHPMTEAGSGLLGYTREYGCALFWEILYSWWIYLRHGFSVIQGCNPPDLIFLVALTFRLFGVKYIFDVHDVSPELYFGKYGKKGVVYKLQLWLEKLSFRSSDVVICTNGSYRKLAIRRGGADPASTFIVRNGPDLRSFKSVPANPALKFGKPYLVGYVGVMGSQDGLDILLEVARYIKGLGRRDVHFTCIGGGSCLNQLREMVREKDLEDMVTFTGRIPDAPMIEILSTADVCVNPDRPCEMNSMSTMVKIMEYMALGKPIVQFDMKEGRFSAAGASLYADNENQVADFAAKILWLLANPAERRRMGELGRRRVEKELAWQYSVEHLMAAYEKASTKHGPLLPQPRASIDESSGDAEHAAAPSAGK